MTKSGIEIGAEHDEALQRYLDERWARQEPLPRRGGKPNLTSIAAACGFDRGVLYANKAAMKRLEDYEPKDRIRFYDKLEQAELQRDRVEASTKQSKAMVQRVIELEAIVQSQSAQLERLRRLERLMLRDGILPT